MYKEIILYICPVKLLNLFVMANYCWNNIEVDQSGFTEIDAKNFRKFISKVAFIREELGDEGNVFEYFLGKAPDNVDLVSYYGCYSPFDVNEFLSHIDEDNIDDSFFNAGFDTKWSPPERFCQMLSEMYQVCVKITYEECGNDFSGHAQYTNGETDYEESWAYLEGIYNMDKDMFWHELDSQMEYAIDDETEIDEFLERFDFLSGDDLEEVKRLYTIEKNHIAENN